MTMKTFFPSLFLCAALSASIMSAAPQQSSDSTKPLPRINDPLFVRLAMSHEQKAQYHAISRDRKMQIDAALADSTLSPRARREKIRDIRAAAETRIRSILNQNQLDEYDQLKRERQERVIGRRDTTMATPQPTNPQSNPQ